MFGKVIGIAAGAVCGLRQAFQESQREIPVKDGPGLDAAPEDRFHDIDYPNKAVPVVHVSLFYRK